MKKQLNRQTLQTPYRTPTVHPQNTYCIPTECLQNGLQNEVHGAKGDDKIGYKTDDRLRAHKKTYKIAHTSPKRPTKNPTKSDG